MKKLTKTLLALGFISAIAVTTVCGQVAYTLTFDENGNINLNGTALPPGVLAVDPLSGMTTLFYSAAPLAAQGLFWAPGDVRLFEPNVVGDRVLSDIVRFEAQSSGAPLGIYFYSEREPTDVPPFDLADVPAFPDQLQPVVKDLDEVGPEGANGALYIPVAGAAGLEPGFVPGLSPNIAYNIISDVVPEPSTLAVLGLAGGLLAIFRRRQSARV